MSEKMVELERRAHRAESGPLLDASITGKRDDLSRIRGITPQDEPALHGAGYHSYSQLARISREEEGVLEERLGLKPGVIAHEQWREQAALLDARKDEEHGRLYGRPSPA
jgi:predicted flap endonuclease-1-like 5' DNA nuclease